MKLHILYFIEFFFWLLVGVMTFFVGRHNIMVQFLIVWVALLIHVATCALFSFKEWKLKKWEG